MSAFQDARTDDVGDVIDASVCVIGSGAAGITLARELSKTMPGVVLVEAGGMEIDGQTQGLFMGRQLGLRYYNLVACRLRYFGGTTNHWSGYCRANDPIDYEGRPELNLPEWPVSHDDLAPYIDKAGETLGIGAKHFEPKEAMRARGLEAGAIAEDSSEILQTKAFQFADRMRLGPLYQEELSAAPHLRTVLNLNLTHIRLDAAGRRVDHLECKTLNGKTVKVTAKAFALCCHAIENARQLLVSNDVMAEGIGNADDHVGRYFMDHIHIRTSKWFPSATFPRIYNRLFAAKNGMNVNLSFTDKHTRDEQLLQYYCRFNPIYFESATTEAGKSLRDNAFEPGDLDYLRDVARVASEVGGVAKFMLARSGWGMPAPDYYEMEHRLEQAPNPASRVVISDRKDMLGSPIADLDWRLNDDDVRSFKKGQSIIAKELSALGWGRFQEEEITRDLVEDRVAGHYHQIGTTRMSENPKDGVVDADCKVHGIENLYVGGSSVFPTAGYSGPTMMIIAFAMRLADHMKGRFA